MAYAGVCKVAENGRPLMAFVYLNLAHLQLLEESQNEEIFSTILHEVHHGLGFMDAYLEFFWDRETKQHRPIAEVVSETATYKRIIRSEVVSWAN